MSRNFLGPMDRIAVHVGTWALRRLYGADCETDISADFPDEPDLRCISCDAAALVKDMQELLQYNTAAQE